MEKNKESKQRIWGLDMLRSSAIFFVLSVHFFGNTKFSASLLYGRNMFIQLNLRWLFYIAVPLFLLLTGYLQGNKTPTKKYYSSIWRRVVFPYIAISVLTILFRVIVQKEKISLSSALVMILSYQANTYSWYVNMYIGLFLFIPFLNIVGSSIWKLHNKKMLFALFGSLLFVTAVPSLLRSMFIGGQRLTIFPSYWEAVYPVLYYYIGFFLNKMADTVKIKKRYLILGIVSLIGLESSLSLFIFRRYYKALFSWDIFEGYGSIFTILASVLYFLLVYNIELKNQILKKVFYTISKHSFNIYLFSKIYDLIFYPYFINRYFVSQPQFLPFYFVIVPLVFICSYLSSIILETLFAQMYKLIFFIRKRCVERNCTFNKG